MAPTRRSSARATSATPARGITPTKRAVRRESIISSENSDAERSPRVRTTQGPSGAAIENPQLPEVKAQQSFAYGSQEVPVLPEQLIAHEKMTLKQMAETIDMGIRQAEQHFEEQAAETEAIFGRVAQTEARTERAKRRSQSKDGSQSSREGSVDSQNSRTRGSRRTAAWASSVANASLLQDIMEEDSQNSSHTSSDIDEEGPRYGSDGPSSFPSGNFDVSYNQERGRRRPATAPTTLSERTKLLITSILQTLLRCILWVYDGVSALPRHLSQFVQYCLESVTHDVNRLTTYMSRPATRASAWDRLGTFVAWTLVAGLFWIVLSTLFCHVYIRHFCIFGSSSTAHQTLQGYCGSCVRIIPLHTDPAGDGRVELSSISRALGSLNQRLQDVEFRADTLDRVLKQQHEMEATTSKLQYDGAHIPIQSPLIEKINYCSPGTGAVIDPYLTSPTKQKQFSWLQKIALGPSGLQKYQSHPPSEVLRPWEDVGDCWCSAPTEGYTQLGVLMGHMVYPTEVVIEHLPSGASPSPGSAPKDLETWADLSHLPAEDHVLLGLDKLPRDPSFGQSFARIGRMTYDATAGANHVQKFRLDVNQEERIFSTQKVVFRATSNYGGEHTCFYRVRVHGAPMTPHPQIKVNGKLV